MASRIPIHLPSFLEANRHLLVPPVGNRQLFTDSEFIVMLIAGPNRRKDYHVDPGEELFYQLHGDITLRVFEDGRIREIPILEGELFLLPSFVPHSPQRPADTVGLVVERTRRPDEEDHFQWYCEGCGHLLHDVALHVKNLNTELAPVLEGFFRGPATLRTCKRCGIEMQPPKT